MKENGALNLGVRRCKMAKNKNRFTAVGVLAVLAFAWTKLGLGDAIKDIGAVIQQPPPPSCPAGEAPRFL